MKLFRYIISAALLGTTLGSCTDLDETLYDQVGTQNYYNTKMDVIRATFRPFEHAFWSIQSRHVLNELPADQLITPTRDGWWDDSGKWRRLHYHEWDVEDGGDAQTEWNGCFQGIMQCNYVIEDLSKLSAERFGFSQAEFDNLSSQCRVLRAWFYLRLLDAFRNVPLAVSYSDVSQNTESQVEPKVIYEKTMKIPDSKIIRYFTLTTDLHPDEIKEIEKELENGANPRDIKMRLARELVTLYHDAESVQGAEEYFIGTYQKNIVTEQTPILECLPEFINEDGSINLVDLIFSSNKYKSKGEIRIENYLIGNNFNYEPQKTYLGLVGLGNGLLSYDFYLPEENLLIEYQGHFHDGIANDYVAQNLDYRQEHDRRKRQYAKDHNIKLLEIWYWDFDKIEDILESHLI